MTSPIVSISLGMLGVVIALYLNYRVIENIRSLVMLLSDSFMVMVKELDAVKTALVELQKERAQKAQKTHAKDFKKPKDYEEGKEQNK